MPKENVSPEEKLLRLIRGHKKPAPLKDEARQTQAAAIKTNTRMPAAKKTFAPSINQIIWAGLIVAIAYLAFSLINPIFVPKEITLGVNNKDKGLQPQKETASEVKPYEYYAQGISSRQIFSAPVQSQQASSPNPAGADFTKDLSLIGIIAGDNPQAVIEDKKIQKTYYLGKGQSVGELKVEEILEGKIIISFRGERLELYL